ncbi:MAG: hypothetical protein WB780_00065, partial [Candidatus Acidiferrales bacterium]
MGFVAAVESNLEERVSSALRNALLNHLRQERFALLQYHGATYEAVVSDFSEPFRWQGASNGHGSPREILHERLTARAAKEIWRALKPLQA